MGYRTSIIAEKGYLVLEAVLLQLTDGDLKRNPCRDGRSEEKRISNSRWNIRVPEVRSNVRKDTLPES